MKPLLPLHRILPLLLGLALGVPSAAQALVQSGDFYQQLVPEGIHRDTARDLVKRLSDGHYAEIGFDDTLSSRVFDRYLMQLDPSRSYFHASDIAEFEPYRHRFDDLLGDGDVAVAYTIYNRYQQRFAERLAYMLGEIERGLGQIDFGVDEELLVDRKAAPWPENPAALQDLWRRQLKNAVLGLKLTGKPPEQVAETLQKRYQSQLTRLRQSRSEDAFQSYMNALAYSFDPHTAYLSPRKSEDFSIDMNLSLEGIGAALQLEDEYTKVVRVIPGGPAQQSRQLNPADRIVAVGQGEDGEMVDIVGWRLDEVVRLIRGPKGTLVRLEIIPSDATDDHQTRTVHLRRDTVRLEDQAASKRLLEFQHEGRNFRIGVIRLPTFYVGTSRDVRKLVLELKGESIDGLVVDLRNNGGGSLEEANTLTGEFIHRGPTVQIRNARGRVSVMSDPDDGIVYDGPLAVLVNGSSASASEIFAGAIQDYRRGLIIGSRTFGKGTVQTLRPLDHGKLKITQAKFYRVSGASTQHEGIVPDIHFPEVLDREQIGESALDGALPWDTIAPVNHQDYVPFDRYLGRLRERHQARSANDTEFTILNAQIARQQELRERKSVSLNEAARKREREAAREFELQLENRRRAARGEAPLTELGDDAE
ncbi:MAG TPA: carboxy terminal-processing peptidase, partial [Gammaproteobacteria bacterium]